MYEEIEDETELYPENSKTLLNKVKNNLNYWKHTHVQGQEDRGVIYSNLYPNSNFEGRNRIANPPIHVESQEICNNQNSLYCKAIGIQTEEG